MVNQNDRRAPAGNPSGRKGILSRRVMTQADEMAFRAQLGRQIRDARGRLGFTQGELAVHLGVSQGRIASYETGRAMPRAHEIPSLCKALGMDPNTLLGFPSPDDRVLEVIAEQTQNSEI